MKIFKTQRNLEKPQDFAQKLPATEVNCLTMTPEIVEKTWFVNISFVNANSFFYLYLGNCVHHYHH